MRYLTTLVGLVLVILLVGCGGEPSAEGRSLRPCHTYNDVVDDYNYNALRGLKLEGRVREVADQAAGTSVEDEANRLLKTVDDKVRFIKASKAMAVACEAVGG